MSKRDLHYGMNKTKWPTGVTVCVQPLVLTKSKEVDSLDQKGLKMRRENVNGTTNYKPYHQNKSKRRKKT